MQHSVSKRDRRTDRQKRDGRDRQTESHTPGIRIKSVTIIILPARPEFYPRATLQSLQDSLIHVAKALSDKR